MPSLFPKLSNLKIIKTSPALYIGRFQPFHLGHLDAVKQILQKEEKIIIAIGSAEQSFLPENPLTAGERYQLIEDALKEAGIDPSSFSILAIRNINNYALWVPHVRLYCPEFKNIYTDSDIVAQLFESDGQHPVIRLTKNLKVSATIIRQKMIDNKNWQELVPPSVTTYLERWKIPQRLQSIKDLA